MFILCISQNSNPPFLILETTDIRRGRALNSITSLFGEAKHSHFLGTFIESGGNGIGIGERARVMYYNAVGIRE